MTLDPEVPPQDQYNREAFARNDPYGQIGSKGYPDGTYELVGPAVQANPYNLDQHQLWNHDRTVLAFSADPADAATGLTLMPTFEGIRAYLEKTRIEGIVWHHPDGRMVKIKRRDFGFEWP